MLIRVGRVVFEGWRWVADRGPGLRCGERERGQLRRPAPPSDFAPPPQRVYPNQRLGLRTPRALESEIGSPSSPADSGADDRFGLVGQKRGSRRWRRHAEANRWRGGCAWVAGPGLGAGGAAGGPQMALPKPRAWNCAWRDQAEAGGRALGLGGRRPGCVLRGNLGEVPRSERVREKPQTSRRTSDQSRAPKFWNTVVLGLAL